MNSVVRKSTGEKVFWIRDITAVGESCPKCAAMDSRGAATECSPRRKPGVFFRDDLSPVGAKDSFAPTGLVCQKRHLPRACARGYTLSPLRGWDVGTSELFASSPLPLHVCRSRFSLRQRDPEGASHSVGFLESELAAVDFDGPLGDRQAETCSAVIAGT